MSKVKNYPLRQVQAAPGIGRLGGIQRFRRIERLRGFLGCGHSEHVVTYHDDRRRRKSRAGSRRHGGGDLAIAEERAVERPGVRYSVNEQVAGHFEVLLAASIARHIGLHGPPATGLAKGTPPQIVIAKAILVTTKGGHNTVKIQFCKKTAARLRRCTRSR